MLTEERRSQLDGIVQKMVQSNESDSNIRFVVDDFKKKYEYESQIQPAQSQQKKGVMGNVASFLGVEKFAQGLSTVLSDAPEVANEINTNDNASRLRILQAIKSERDPVKKQRLINANQKIWGDSQAVSAGDINPGFDLSTREVLGSAANVGLNTLTPSAFRGGLGAKVAKNAALGASFGLAGGLNNDESGEDLIESTLIGSAIGGAIPLAGRAAGKLKKVVTETLPEKIYNRAVKPTLDELRKNVKFGTDTLGSELLKDGVKGNPERLLTIANDQLSANENKLQELLKGSKATIKRADLEKYLEELRVQTEGTPGLGSEVDKIQAVLREFPEEVSIQQANKIKRNIYNELRNVGYKLDASLSTKREAMKALAKGLKTEVENKSDNPELVRSLNKKLGVYGRLEDRIVDVIARNNKNNLFGLTDAILAGGGLAAGSPIGFLAAAGKHVIGSTRGQTGLAVGLNALKNVGQGKAAAVSKNLIKRGLLNAP